MNKQPFNVQDATIGALYDARCLHEAVISAYYAASDYHAKEALHYWDKLAPHMDALRTFLEERK